MATISCTAYNAFLTETGRNSSAINMSGPQDDVKLETLAVGLANSHHIRHKPFPVLSRDRVFSRLPDNVNAFHNHPHLHDSSHHTSSYALTLSSTFDYRLSVGNYHWIVDTLLDHHLLPKKQGGSSSVYLQFTVLPRVFNFAQAYLLKRRSLEDPEKAKEIAALSTWDQPLVNKPGIAKPKPPVLVRIKSVLKKVGFEFKPSTVQSEPLPVAQYARVLASSPVSQENATVVSTTEDKSVRLASPPAELPVRLASLPAVQEGVNYTFYTPRPSASVTKDHLKGLAVEGKYGRIHLIEPPILPEVQVEEEEAPALKASSKTPPRKKQRKPFIFSSLVYSLKELKAKVVRVVRRPYPFSPRPPSPQTPEMYMTTPLGPDTSLKTRVAFTSAAIDRLIHSHPDLHRVISVHFDAYARYIVNEAWVEESEKFELQLPYQLNVAFHLSRLRHYIQIPHTAKEKLAFQRLILHTLLRTVVRAPRIFGFDLSVINPNLKYRDYMNALYAMPFHNHDFINHLMRDIPLGRQFLQKLLEDIVRNALATIPTSEPIDPTEEIRHRNTQLRRMQTPEMEETEVKQENVTFADQRESETTQGFVTNQVETNAQQISMQEKTWTVEQILNKPILLDAFEWSTEDEYGKELKSYKCPGKTLVGQHKTQLKTFCFWRGHPYFRIQLNSTKFHFGRLLVVWIPMYAESQFTNYLWDVDQLTSFPCCYLDAATSNSAELRIPFVHMDTYFNTATKRDWNYLGELKVFVFNRLGGTTNVSPQVDVSIWISYDNCALHQPMWEHEVQFPEMEERVQTPESGLEGLAKSVLSTAATTIPGLSTFTSLVKTAGNVAGAVADLDKPTNPQEIVRWVPNVVSSLNFGEGLDQSNRLSLAPGTATVPDAAMISTTEDDGNLKLIAQIPTRLGTFLWKTSHAQKYNIFTLQVYPTSVVRQADDTTVSPNVTVYQPTLLAYISRVYKYWRGTIKYRIQIVSSQMQTGRLQFSFVPGIWTDSFTFSNMMNVKIVDLQEKNEIEIEVPYMSERPYLRCDKFFPKGRREFHPECFTGYFNCHVVNRLTAPDATAQQVEINVFVSAGADFDLAFPTDISFYKGSGKVIPKQQAESQEYVTGRTDSPPAQPLTAGGGLISSSPLSIMGEGAMQLKTVLRRYTKVLESTVTAKHRTFISFPNTPHLSSVTADFGSTYHIQFRTLLSHFSELFTFWRGSLRYKLILNGLTQHVTLRVFHVPGVYRFDATGADASENMDQMFGMLETNGTMVGSLYIQGSLEFEVPFYTPYAVLQTIEGNKQSARSATGTLFVVISSPFLDTEISFDLYQAAGDDFQPLYLRGAPRVQLEKGMEETRTTEDDAVNLYTALPFSSTPALHYREPRSPTPEPPQDPEMFTTVRNVMNMPNQLTTTLKAVEDTSKTLEQAVTEVKEIGSKSADVVTLALNALGGEIGTLLGGSSKGLLGWTVSVSILVTGFNSFIQTSSIIVKAAAIVSIVSELLGTALDWVRNKIIEVVYSVLETINGTKQGNQVPEMLILDFAAPLVAALGVGALVLGFKQLPSDKQTMDIIKGINEKLRLFNQSSLLLSNIKSLYSQLKDLTDWIMDYVLSLVAPQLLAQLKLERGLEDIETWVKEVEEIYSDIFEEKSNFDMNYRNKCLQLAERGRKIQALLMQGKVGREGGVLKQTLAKAFEIETKVKTSHQKLPNRIDPLSICIFGNPGIGKSTVIHEILHDTMDHLHYPKENRICNLNWHETFFTENYANQPAVYGDDISALQSEEQYKTFFNLKANTALPLNMAFKKGLMFTSDIIAMTSNTPYPNPNFVNCKDALLRRRDILIEVEEVTAGAAKQADFSHLHFRTRSPTDPQAAAGPWMTLDQLKEHVRGFATRYFVTQKIVLRRLLMKGGYLLPPGLKTPEELENENGQEFDLFIGQNAELFEKKEIVLDYERVERDVYLYLYSDQDWIRKLKFYPSDDPRGGLYGLPEDATDDDVGEFAFCRRQLSTRGVDVQARLFQCSRVPLRHTISLKLDSLKQWLKQQWARALESFPSLGDFATWPVKLAVGLVALGSALGLTARYAHKCSCATLRFFGYRCAKCGKWPSLEKCKDKDWLLKEWSTLYGKTEEYEDGRVTTLEEENNFLETQGSAIESVPLIGTSRNYAEVYSQVTSGGARPRVFAETYNQNTPGQRVTRLFAEGGQKFEDLITYRCIPYTYRVRGSAGGMDFGQNAVAIGGRKLLLNKHFACRFKKGDFFEIFHANTWMKINYDPDRAIPVDKKDLVVYEMPVQFHQHRSLARHFISEKELGKIARTKGYLIRRLDENRTTEVQLNDIVAVRHVRYSDSLGNTYEVQNAWKYPLYKANGSCCSMLVSSDPRLEGQILGLHVSGDGESARAQLLTREMVEEMLKESSQLGTPVPQTVEMKLALHPEGHFSTVGRVKADEGVFQSTKSQIIPTEIHGLVREPVTEPSVLSQLDPRLTVRTNVMKKAIEKYGKCPTQFDSTHIGLVFNSLESEFETMDLPREPRVLTKEEAVLGCPEYEGFERLPLNTSPGYPYTLTRPSGCAGKSYMFNENGEITDPVLQTKYLHRLALAKRGERVPSVWTCCLKDERRPTAKIREGSTRLFVIPPVDLSLVTRQYTLDFSVALQHNRHTSFCKVGIDPQSLEFTALWDYLAEHSDVCFAGDFSQFDGTIPPELSFQFYEHCDAFYKRHDTNYKEEDRKVRMTLADESVHTVHIVGRDIFVNHTGNESGDPNTTKKNSVVNYYYMALAWLGLASKHDPSHMNMASFRKHVRLAVFGDDNVVAVKREVTSWYNQTTVADFLFQYGIVYTNSEKNGVTPVIKLSEATFLKNAFGDHESICGVKVPLMAKDTIYELLNWTRIAPDQHKLLNDNINDALRFAYFHGSSFFSQLRGKILAALKQRNIKCSVMTYDDFHFWFLFVIGQLPRLRSAEGFFEKIAANGNGQWTRLLAKTVEALPYKLLSMTGLLARDSDRPPTDDRHAIAIPSGEGKSWLCTKYPEVFVDHDDLLLPLASKSLKDHGLSVSALAKIFDQEFPREDRRILLTHHPDNTMRKVLGTYVLPKPCYIRANVYGRLRLKNPKRLDREQRNTEILALARSAEPQLFCGFR